MKGKGQFVEGVIKYKGIVYFIVALLVCLGVYGLLNINKDEFPTFEIKEGLVVGVYPGAKAAEVEQQLTKPIEELLFSFPEVDRSTYSYSKDGMCYIYVILDVSKDRKEEVWSEIKLKLNAHKAFLPAGVLTVQVLDDFSSVSSVLVALESSDKGYGEMQDYAEELCRRLREIPTLANAKIYGAQDEEIAVFVDMDRLSAYGLNPAQLIWEYQTSTLQTMSGTFKTDYANSPIHVVGNIATEKEVAEKIVWADPDGDVVRLKDIADIGRRYKAPVSFVEYNGNAALIISVEMRPDNNIIFFGEDVDRVLNEFMSEVPDSITLTKITDMPQVVDGSIWSFLRDLVISMVVVILVMMLLFRAKSAFIASSGVPICTIVTIGVMYLAGMNLNTVTLAALIVVLGMIVDNSIITIDGYMDNLSRGMDRMEAASRCVRDLFVPMLLATASISLMFYPMLGIITGYLGDFVKSFPWIITISLMSSLVYAVTVVPSLEVRFIESAKSTRESRFSKMQDVFFNVLQTGYEKLETICFRYPYVTVGVGVLSIILGVLMFMQINVQMMPMAVRSCFAVEIYLDPNSSLKDTKAVSDSLQNVLLADSRVTSVTSFVGMGAPRFHATYAPKAPAESFAQLIVNTRTSKDTENMLKEYERSCGNSFPEALIRFKQMDYQGVMAPVAVQFTGGSVEEMKPYADSLRAFMTDMDDMLKWVHSDCDSYVSTVDVRLDSDEASRLGVNRTLLSLSLAGAFNGLPVAALWEDGVKIPVTLYSTAVNDQMLYETLANQVVATSMPGVSVPLRQVASIEPSWEPEAIPHTGGEESLTVYADMLFGCSQPVAMKKISKYVTENLLPDLPSGVRVSYGGLSSTNRALLPEITMTLLSAVAVLFFFLLFHFKKISLAVLTLVLSLLCLFGASFGLWVFDLDFGITSVLGVVSLIGIIVRNGIMMFEYAEQLRFEQGYDVKEAAMESGRRRMRPIFLTSCTTALGVLPMIITGDALWMPMGVVICFGTLLSIILIVEIMPVCYWLIFRKA